MEWCVPNFKEGNQKMKWGPKHRFKKDGLDRLCNKYWTGYLKAWTPWHAHTMMFPDPQKIADYGNDCESRDWHRHTTEWFYRQGKFLFPDVGETGNTWIKDCGKFFDLVAEANEEPPEDMVIENPKKCTHPSGKAVKVKDGYCHSLRVGLGTDEVHGKGNPSLDVCANLAKSDDRCSGDGYFDAEKFGDTFQCKCPRGTCIETTNPRAGHWAIYQYEPSEMTD